MTDDTDDTPQRPRFHGFLFYLSIINVVAVLLIGGVRLFEAAAKPSPWNETQRSSSWDNTPSPSIWHRSPNYRPVWPEGMYREKPLWPYADCRHRVEVFIYDLNRVEVCRWPAKSEN